MKNNLGIENIKNIYEGQKLKMDRQELASSAMRCYFIFGRTFFKSMSATFSKNVEQGITSKHRDSLLECEDGVLIWMQIRLEKRGSGQIIHGFKLHWIISKGNERQFEYFKKKSDISVLCLWRKQELA